MSISGRLHIQTNSPDVLSEAIGTLVAPSRAVPLQTGCLDFFGDFIGWSDFTIGEFRSGSGVILEPLKPQERLICAITTSGHVTYSAGKRSLVSKPGEVAICDSQILDRATFSEHTSRYFVTTSMASLDAFAKSMHDVSKMSLSGWYALLPQNHLATRALMGFTPLVSQLLLDRDLLALSPIKMRRCKDAFLEIVTSALSSEGHFAGLSSVKSGTLRHLRDAEDYILAHARLAIGVAEIAAAIGISVRSLQHIYRIHTGTTPLARLQRVRLEGLKLSLETEEVVDWRMTAASWGFVSVTRLLGQYRTAFRETPEDTIRRRWRS